MTGDERSQARPLFRQIAIVVALFCFILAGVIGWTHMEGRWVGIGISLFVGFMMMTIAVSGRWPHKR